jgi:hypothetical protein
MAASKVAGLRLALIARFSLQINFLLTRHPDIWHFMHSI